MIEDLQEQQEESFSLLPGLVSLNIHLALLLVLAFFVMRPKSVSPPVVLELNPNSDEQTTVFESFDIEMAEVEPVLTEPEPETVEMEPLPEPELVELGESEALEAIDKATQMSQLVSLKGMPGEFANRIRDAQANGIEIVIVFDATGSMGSEIAAVKAKIQEICNSVLNKIPKARFSLVAYRDRGDRFLVKGKTLTSNADELSEFMSGIDAGGGGDRPEAVESGMDWAMTENQFRYDSQKVMLIFGDAPPHQNMMPDCVRMAREFGGYRKGVVHTVTCRSGSVMPEFYEIASAGDGTAYTMMNSGGLVEELLVLAFGRRHRASIIKFFELKLQENAKTPSNTRQRSRRRRR